MYTGEMMGSELMITTADWDVGVMMEKWFHEKISSVLGGILKKINS